MLTIWSENLIVCYEVPGQLIPLKIAPNPNSNPNTKSNPNRGAIFLGDNFPDTAL